VKRKAEADRIADHNKRVINDLNRKDTATAASVSTSLSRLYDPAYNSAINSGLYNYYYQNEESNNASVFGGSTASQPRPGTYASLTPYQQSYTEPVERSTYLPPLPGAYQQYAEYLNPSSSYAIYDSYGRLIHAPQQTLYDSGYYSQYANSLAAATVPHRYDLDSDIPCMCLDCKRARRNGVSPMPGDYLFDGYP
jgi:hypothetical protein